LIAIGHLANNRRTWLVSDTPSRSLTAVASEGEMGSGKKEGPGGDHVGRAMSKARETGASFGSSRRTAKSSEARANGVATAHHLRRRTCD
jgi:hypothetical protein